MTTPRPPRNERLGSTRVMALAEALTEREWSILATVNRLRLAIGLQLERLHFAELTSKSRSVVRWRVLKRLVDAQALVPLARRVGGSLRGSAQLTYALDTAGERLLRLRRNLSQTTERIRRPGPIGDRFVAHTLATSELCVQLTERSRAESFTLDGFQAEPAAWWPNGDGGWMKPDAYLSISAGEFTDHWWIEVDLATEAVPTLRGKFLAYIDFVALGQLGPGGVMPRVLVTVPTPERRDVIASIVTKLPAPADELFAVVLHCEAVSWLTAELSEAGHE